MANPRTRWSSILVLWFAVTVTADLDLGNILGNIVDGIDGGGAGSRAVGSKGKSSGEPVCPAGQVRDPGR